MVDTAQWHAHPTKLDTHKLHRLDQSEVAETVLILQHPGEAETGTLRAWLHDNKYRTELVDVVDELPVPNSFRALIVPGHPAAVYDSTPWIEDERRFITDCAAQGTPVLGICFGAQLLAEVLGGCVRPMEEPELGWCEFTGADPYGGSWFSWHGDQVLPPAHAIALASSDNCIQAFRVGHHVGVQFHPEMTHGLITKFLDERDRQQRLADHGVSLELTLIRSAELADDAALRARRIYTDFFSCHSEAN